MANEFPCAFRNDLRERAEKSLVKRSCYNHTQGAVGRYKAFLFDGIAEFTGERVQNPNFSIARPQTRPGEQVTGFYRSPRPEGIAERAHATGTGGPKDRSQNRGKQVSMLVRIQMRNGNVLGLNLANLCCRLGLDFVRVHASG